MTISTKFSPAEVALADELAARLGVTRAALLRRALLAVAAHPDLVASSANPILTIVREHEGRPTIVHISDVHMSKESVEALRAIGLPPISSDYVEASPVSKPSTGETSSTPARRGTSVDRR